MHHSMILTTLPIIFITHFVSLFLSDPKSTAIALACFLHVKIRSKIQRKTTATNSKWMSLEIDHIELFDDIMQPTRVRMQERPSHVRRIDKHRRVRGE
jgi:hypothetical protein